MLMFDQKLIYFYNVARPIITNISQIITWGNHIPDRANCGATFTTLEQYEHILKAGAFHCIIFDGSIIRSSFTFEGNSLKAHSHLWWPSPYIENESFSGEYTPQNRYEDFLTDPNLKEKIRMRTPVRIDYDPTSETEIHPLIHMHTQHHESRIYIEKPICFNKFVKYIFQNFYPDIDLDCSKWNFLNFTYERAKVSQYKLTSSVVF
jgi:hypothetical protein